MKPEERAWLNSQLDALINKKYTEDKTPQERVKDTASVLPIVGDAVSGYDALQAYKKGNYGEAALNAVGLLPFIPGLAGMTKYVRRSQSVSDPMNEVGYAMFKEADTGLREGLDRLKNYGPGMWAATDVGATPVKDIQKNLIKELRAQGIAKEYGTSAASLAREANPSDIVSSAGLWDNPDVVSAIYRNVIERPGIRAIKTDDGLIVFDRDKIKRVGRK